ncbi:MAG: DsbA family protein [Alphaproteobacteria bacterium]
MSQVVLSLLVGVFVIAGLPGAQAAAMSDKPKSDAITEDHKEPDLKVTKGSGGKSTSYLVKDAPLPSDHVMGKETAPIVILEYASLSCPHCAHFSSAVLPEIKKNYIDTGRAKYILRQFPLNEPALKGAMLLDCIGEQNHDQYYIFSHVLFDAQNKWAFDGNFMEGLETIATVGGLSKGQFASCVNSTDREMKVLQAKKTATEELAIPHTPYFFIDGEVYGGAPNYEEMAAFIDKRMKLRAQ